MKRRVESGIVLDLPVNALTRGADEKRVPVTVTMQQMRDEVRSWE